MNKQFTEVELQTPGKHEKMTISRAMRKMQILLPKRHHFTTLKGAKMKKPNENKYWRQRGTRIPRRLVAL